MSDPSLPSKAANYHQVRGPDLHGATPGVVVLTIRLSNRRMHPLEHSTFYSLQLLASGPCRACQSQ